MKIVSFESVDSKYDDMNPIFLDTSHVLFNSGWTLCGLESHDLWLQNIVRKEITCKTCRKMIQKLADKL